MTVEWPTAALDPIMRLRAVAAAFPNAGVAEVVLDVPYEDAWTWLMDLEHSVPSFDTEVDRVRVRRRHPDGLSIWAWSHGVPFPFDVTVDDGFCIMQAKLRAFVVVMAAVPIDDARTRYAHAEAVPALPTPRLRGRLQRMVDADCRRLQRVIRD